MAGLLLVTAQHPEPDGPGMQYACREAYSSLACGRTHEHSTRLAVITVLSPLYTSMTGMSAIFSCDLYPTKA